MKNRLFFILPGSIIFEMRFFDVVEEQLIFLDTFSEDLPAYLGKPFFLRASFLECQVSQFLFTALEMAAE